MLVSILAAIAAGGCFAAGGVLQQGVASTRPEDESLSVRLLTDLLHQKRWLAGIGMAVLSYLFQSIALAFGPLAVVQPVIVTELLFALPISVRLHGMRLRAREWSGAAAIAAGLAIGIVSAFPHGGNPLPSTPHWIEALGSVAILAAVGLLLGRRLSGPVRASLFALAAATILAAQSALLAATIALLEQGVGATFSSWQPYVMVAASIGGLLLVQSAYQAGPLAASMPVMDAVEPVVAIGIGIGIFDEVIHTGWLNLVGTAIGLASLLVGIVTLDTSPVVHRLQQVERQDRQEHGEAAGRGRQREAVAGEN